VVEGGLASGTIVTVPPSKVLSPVKQVWISAILLSRMAGSGRWPMRASEHLVLPITVG